MVKCNGCCGRISGLTQTSITEQARTRSKEQNHFSFARKTVALLGLFLGSAILYSLSQRSVGLPLTTTSSSVQGAQNDKAVPFYSPEDPKIENSPHESSEAFNTNFGEENIAHFAEIMNSLAAKHGINNVEIIRQGSIVFVIPDFVIPDAVADEFEQSYLSFSKPQEEPVLVEKNNINQDAVM